MPQSHYNRARWFLLLLLLLGGLTSPGQEILYKGKNIIHIDSVEVNAQPVHFLLVGDTTGGPKPLLVFLRGSTPTPLLVDVGGGRTGALFLPFPYQAYLERVNLLFVTKPGVPILAKLENLTSSYHYLDPQTQEVPESFTRQNLCEPLTQMAVGVLTSLENRKWIDAEHVILVGHSQGAIVGTSLASRLSMITHFAYLSADPRGRFMEIVRRERMRIAEMETGQAEAYQDLMDAWAAIMANPKSQDMFRGNTYESWASFSRDLVGELVAMNIPVFLGFGTADISSANCDVVYLEALRQGKSHIHFHPVIDTDHNFFPLDGEGRVDYENGKWESVFSHILDWALKP
ncbi:MAG: hypothetical protein AAFO96_23570 [Bacteroidota bacterium]